MLPITNTENITSLELVKQINEIDELNNKQETEEDDLTEYITEEKDIDVILKDNNDILNHINSLVKDINKIKLD